VPTALTPGNLEKRVRKEKRPTLALFFGEWCGFCDAFRPTWEKWAKDRKAEVVQIALDYDGPVWSEWNVEVVPTVVAYADGEERDRKTARINTDDLDRLLERTTG
jgi:thioredoxin 1